ncbi:Luciferin 4-monooxygenase [Anthophora plagiata]
MKIENNILYSSPLTGIPNVSLGQYILDQLRAKVDLILQVDTETGNHYTYKDILTRSIALAIVLKNYGIAVEDRIVVATENHPNYLVAMCGSLFVGATFAPLNPTYTEREFKHMLEIFEPRVIFVSQRTEKIIAKVSSTFKRTVKIITMDDKASERNVITLNELIQGHKQTAFDYSKFTATPVGDNSKKTAAILCSSGTTGFPKGVMLSHRSIIIFITNARIPSLLDTRKGDRLLLFLPMFHGYAFALLNMTILSGSAIYVMRSFDFKTFLSLIEKYKLTHVPVVPPILVHLSKHPEVTNYDFSSVREVICGAAPLSLGVAAEVIKRTKVPYIRNGYGMTESAVVTHINDRRSTDDNVGSLLPGLKFKVIDPQTNKVLPPGQVGELCISGDQIMLGYFRNPKMTAETIDKEKWLHTGDLGYFNENGVLYITGRLKELIKYKGFQVSPSEIETLLLKHPSIQDVAVIGIPDELCGELPMALVVKQPDSNITGKEIVEFANSNLSPQKWLRGGVRFVQNIPKTASGKIIRRELTGLSKL